MSLDLRAPPVRAGIAAEDFGTFPSGLRQPMNDRAEPGSRVHGPRPGLVLNEANWRMMSPAEGLVHRVHREGVPLARLWQSESSLLSIGLNPHGRPGVWFTKTIH